MADLETLIPLNLSVGMISNILEFLKRTTYTGLNEAKAVVQIEAVLVSAALEHDAKSTPKKLRRKRKKPR